MKTVLRTGAVFCLVTLLTISGQAADQKEVKKGPPKGDRMAGLFSFPKQIQLDEKQQTKLEALKKEYAPQLEALHSQYAKIMTPERQKTAAQATKAARDAGKKGKEIGEAVNAALNLTSQEQAQMKDLNQKRMKLAKEIQTKKLALLTPEQKALLQPKPKDKKDK